MAAAPLKGKQQGKSPNDYLFAFCQQEQNFIILTNTVKSALGLCANIFLWGGALMWLAVYFFFFVAAQNARQGFKNKMCSTPKERQWRGQMFSLSR